MEQVTSLSARRIEFVSHLGISIFTSFLLVRFRLEVLLCMFPTTNFGCWKSYTYSFKCDPKGSFTHVELTVTDLHTQMPKGTRCVSLRQCLTQYQRFDIEKRKPTWILITCLKRVGFAENTWVHADITGQKYSTCELDINDMLMIWCGYSGHICDDYVCQRCMWIFIGQGITLCQDFIADINLYMHDWCQVDLNQMLGVEVCAKTNVLWHDG